MLTMLDISETFGHPALKTVLHFVNPFAREGADEPSDLTDPISLEWRSGVFYFWKNFRMMNYSKQFPSEGEG